MVETTPFPPMKSAEAAEVQRVWKAYQGTGRAIQAKGAPRLVSLYARFPCLFTPSESQTKLVPTMTLFAVARTLEEHARLGRMPSTIVTPAGVIKLAEGND